MGAFQNSGQVGPAVHPSFYLILIHLTDISPYGTGLRGYKANLYPRIHLP